MLLVQDAHSDLWEGSRSGLDGAFTLTGVDRTESMANFSTIMDSTLTKLAKANVWYASTSKQRFVHPEIHSKSIQTALRNVHKDLIIDPSPIFQELRLIKSEEEVKLMQTSNDIASAAFQEVIKFSKPNVQEAHLWAKMDFECRLGGAQYLAYQPVVAGQCICQHDTVLVIIKFMCQSVPITILIMQKLSRIEA